MRFRSTERARSAPSPLPAAVVERWLVADLAKRLRRPAVELAVDATFASFGIDSVEAVGMTGDLSDWLGWALDPTVVFDFETIAALASHVAERDAQETL